ncbi:hypothetical protein HPP92_023655 [Vanilla planifolia]|nr:hypothetical protein HPP92_023655 [Vanilla planifolia]
MKIPKTSGQLLKPHESAPPYEPTSVLDPQLTSSPSTVAAGNIHPPTAAVLYPHRDQPPLTLAPTSVEPVADDWPDPLVWLLCENPCPDIEDPSFFPDVSHLSSPPPRQANFDSSHVDLLFSAAHSVEIGDINSAQGVLARLNALQPFPSGGPLQRAAFHFKDALLALLPIPYRPAGDSPLSPIELVRRIAAYKALSDLSPIPQFTSLTANQALLDALDVAPSSLHLIDFDLGLGGQWSSFVQEIASRSRASRSIPPPIRITAVVAEEDAENMLAAENLREFARGLGLRLTIEFVQIGGLGPFALRGVRIATSEAVAVVLSPTIFRLIDGASVLSFIRRVAPRVVVFIDTECCCGSGWSFRRRFAYGLEYYAAVFEAVEAGAAAVGAGMEAVRRIEMAVMRPRIFTTVAAAGVTVDWREVMAAAGMVAVELSEFTKLQANCLLRRSPAEGFHVAQRNGAMVLSWRGKEVAATSAWRCR